MIKERLPLVFYHKGNSDYLKVSLDASKKYAQRVILVGDFSNRNLVDEWVNTDELNSEKLNSFKKVYKNLSLNGELFEYRCFERYFYIYEACVQLHIKKFIMCDSDLLIFSELDDIFRGYDLAFSNTVGNNGALSPHCSLWTIEEMNSFINFLIAFYENDIHILENIFNDYKKHNNKGGICDMTLLWLWCKKYDKRYLNTALQFTVNGEKCCIDHAIHSGTNGTKDEYIKSRLTGCKVIKWNNDIPYFIKKDGHKVRVLAAHCSGGYKNYMSHISKNKFNILCLFILRVMYKLVRKM